jgi:hypothetical protein
MNNFAEIMATKPPHLVVLYKREDNTDKFQWGISGGIQLLTLVGSIVRVQSDIVNQLAEQCNECPEVAFVMVFSCPSAPAPGMLWFLHKSIPVDPLVGMLETIKAALMGSKQAQHMASNKTQVLGPDGQPIRRGMA